MSTKLAIVLGGFVMAVMLVACLVAVLKIDLEPEAEKGPRVVRERNFGEGIRLSRHGVMGVDLVSIGKARMRKLRKGPFAIGAINELVLEDVALSLPEELWKVGQDKGQKAEAKGEAGQRTEDREKRGPRAMLSRLGIKPGNLKFGEKIPRFSALTIRKLRVARLDGTNAVPWFVAQHGEAQREGLALTEVWAIENGRTNEWKEALLLVEPELQLIPTR